MSDDPLLTRLDSAGEQGFQLCAEAASRIRRGALNALQAQHMKNRADNLAAAYAKLREEFLTLREIANDLEPVGEIDFDMWEDAATRLRERLSAIAKATDPDTIGERIVAQAALVPGLQKATEDLTQKLATAGPPLEPGYWMNETSGVLRPAIEAYLCEEELSVEYIAALRAYLRQWIMSDVWDQLALADLLHAAGLARLRADIEQLTSRQAISVWLFRAGEIGLDPL